MNSVINTDTAGDMFNASKWNIVHGVQNWEINVKCCLQWSALLSST